MESVGERWCGLLRTLGHGGAFDAALFDTIVAGNAAVSEEKKELSGSAYRTKLAWMHDNGFVAEGVSWKPDDNDGQCFTARWAFVKGTQRFGQSKFFFVRDGRVLAVRRSDAAADFVAAHPFLPSAATASRILPEDRFGFLIVCKSASIRATPRDSGVSANPGVTVPALRPMPAVQCVVSYEPGPVQVFDRTDKGHLAQLATGWRLGSLVATAPAASASPSWEEEGLLSVAKRLPAADGADVVNVELFDQQSDGAVFVGSCAVPVHRGALSSDDWNELELPLWYGGTAQQGSVRVALKIQNASIPAAPASFDARNDDAAYRSAVSALGRSAQLAKQQPVYKKTTVEARVVRGERIELAGEVLMTVGKVAFEVAKFALKFAH